MKTCSVGHVRHWLGYLKIALRRARSCSSKTVSVEHADKLLKHISAERMCHQKAAHMHDISPCFVLLAHHHYMSMASSLLVEGYEAHLMADAASCSLASTPRPTSHQTEQWLLLLSHSCPMIPRVSEEGRCCSQTANSDL